eukprot:jgi/Mesen1/823/ME000111S10971
MAVSCIALPLWSSSVAIPLSKKTFGIQDHSTPSITSSIRLKQSSGLTGLQFSSPNLLVPRTWNAIPSKGVCKAHKKGKADLEAIGSESSEAAQIDSSDGRKNNSEQGGSSRKGAYQEVGDGSFARLIQENLSSLSEESQHQLGLLGHASDEEVVHDLRVTLRRLRSAVNTFNPFLQLPKEVQHRSLSALLRSLGGLRDADVMQGTLEKLAGHAAAAGSGVGEEEEAALASARKLLVAHRKSSYALATRVLHSRKTGKLLDALEAWLEEPSFSSGGQKVAEADAELAVPSLLAPHVASMLLHPAWHIHHIELEKKAGRAKKSSHKHGAADEAHVQQQHLDDAMLEAGPSHCMHDLRKHLREVRYRMELLQSEYSASASGGGGGSSGGGEGGDKFQGALARVKKLQSTLGDLQDFYVLADFIRPRLRKQPTPGLARALTSIQDEIWAEWLETRDTVGSLDGQQKLYKALMKPGKAAAAGGPPPGGKHSSKPASSSSSSNGSAASSAAPSGERTDLKPHEVESAARPENGPQAAAPGEGGRKNEGGVKEVGAAGANEQQQPEAADTVGTKGGRGGHGGAETHAVSVEEPAVAGSSERGTEAEKGESKEKGSKNDKDKRKQKKKGGGLRHSATNLAGTLIS